MIKCTKSQVRRLKTALRLKIPAEQRQRIQMVLLRESGMTQPLIAAAMGVSLSTVNRAHIAYDHGGIEALKPKPNGGRKRENMTLEEEKALLARGRWSRRNVEHPRSQDGLRKDHRSRNQQEHNL
jgi:transposase